MEMKVISMVLKHLMIHPQTDSTAEPVLHTEELLYLQTKKAIDFFRLVITEINMNGTHIHTHINERSDKYCNWTDSVTEKSPLVRTVTF